ncbi:MAG: SET domain-containing protein [Saprospiraceae bacterium]|nr:SET domain-containing protein [Saprospiraceae bacterium]
MQRIPSIYVGKSSLHHRGVFASRDIEEGTTLEICPVILIPKKEVPIIDSTVLHDYYFTWGDEQTEGVIVLGYGSIYNHAVDANADFIMDYEAMTMDFVANRYIAAGEEITINYNGDKGNATPVWFEMK